MNNRQRFSKKLKRLIKERFKQQKIFAEKLDFNESQVGRWIKGTYLPNLDTLYKIADYCEIDINYFFTDEDSCESIDEELFDEVFYYAYKFADKEKLQIHGKLFLACYQSTRLVLKDNPKMSVEKAFNSVTPILLKLVKSSNI